MIDLRSMLQLLLVSACLCLGSTAAADFPTGWRMPLAAELKRDLFRQLANNPYVEAYADFNGDGVGDAAYIVKSVKFSGEALVVRLSQGASFDWQVLHTIDWGTDSPNIGVSMAVEVAAGREYATVCAEDYRECPIDEMDSLVLNNPAIAYFRFESARSLFYWSDQTNSFSRAWIRE